MLSPTDRALAIFFDFITYLTAATRSRFQVIYSLGVEKEVESYRLYILFYQLYILCEFALYLIMAVTIFFPPKTKINFQVSYRHIRARSVSLTWFYETRGFTVTYSVRDVTWCYEMRVFIYLLSTGPRDYFKAS